MPILNKIYSMDEKEYYIYIPGTTHYDEDRFGNPIYVKDYYYLDCNFNKFVMQCDSNSAKDFADKLIKSGKDVIIGSCAPFTETKHGDIVPYSNPNIKGIWEKPTVDQLTKYRTILNAAKKTLEMKLA